MVVAEPYEQFDGAKFYDTPYVREHRARMLRSIQSGSPGFGLRFDVEEQSLLVTRHGLGQATIVCKTTSGLEITTSLGVREDGTVVQSSQIRSSINHPVKVSYSMDFGISINRASYGQLTEGGPIPIPKSENKIEVVNSGLAVTVTNYNLDSYLHGQLECNGEAVDLGRHIADGTFMQSPVQASISGSLVAIPGSTTELMALFELRPGKYIPSEPEHRISFGPTKVTSLWPSPETPGLFIVRRNLEYILGNCAVSLSPTADAVCILTDHVALPLGWMRDN